MVLQSVIFGLLSALGLGFSDLVGAAVTRRLGVLRIALGVHLSSVAMTTIYLVAAASLDVISFRHWGALVGLSVMGFALYLGFYRALQLGPVAIVSPIVSTNAVVVVLLAMVFLGERLSAGQAVGVAATIAGVVLASVDLSGVRSGDSLIGRGVLIALAATLGIGLWSYSIGVLSKDLGWFLPIYVNRLLTLAILAPVSVARRAWPWQRLTKTVGVGLALVAILETGSLFAFARGAEVGVISILAAASTTYPIVPILGGVLFFRERLAMSQWVGLAIVLVGLLVLGLNT